MEEQNTVVEQPKKSKLPIVILVIVLIVGACVGGIFIGKNMSNKEKPTNDNKVVDTNTDNKGKEEEKKPDVVEGKKDEEEDKKEEKVDYTKYEIKSVKTGKTLVEVQYRTAGAPEDAWNQLEGPIYTSSLAKTTGNCWNKGDYLNDKDNCSEEIKTSSFTFKYEIKNGVKKYYYNGVEISGGFSVLSSIYFNDEEFLILNNTNEVAPMGGTVTIIDSNGNIVFKSDSEKVLTFLVKYKNSDGTYRLYAKDSYTTANDGWYYLDFSTNKLVSAPKPAGVTKADTVYLISDHLNTYDYLNS